MSTDEFLKKQDEKYRLLVTKNKPLELAVRSVMAEQSKRIFINGLNASNGVIGSYKGGEIYVSPNANKSLPKFPLKGKYGNAKFKDGSPHKTGYFTSYLSFKEKIGRNKKIKTVDLFLTGALQRNWSNAKVLSGAMARRINSNNYVVALTNENYVKTERYGNVFGLSKSEKDVFIKVLNYELNEALK